MPGNRIYFYSVHDLDWEKVVLQEQQRSVNFPVSLDYMQADKEFVRLQPGQSYPFGSVRVSTIKNVHPGDAYAFRFEDSITQKVFVYASDAEYKQFNEAGLKPYLDFFKDADVLLFDSQLTLREATVEKEDWGHSSALIGVDLARRSGVKNLVLFHHDPTDSDLKLLQAQAEAIEYQAQDSTHPPCEVIVAHEGLTFDLAPPAAVTLQHFADDQAAVLTLAPIFDERSVDDFEQQVAHLADLGWPARLIIDLTQVKSLAIVGLNPLIALRRTYPDTVIALAGPSDQVQHVIKLAGFLDFFTIYPSVQIALAVTKTQTAAGHLLADRYQIEDELNKGWLGPIFAGSDLHRGQRVAVKYLAAPLGSTMSDQLLDQARQICDFDHPNIVNIIACGRDQDRGYIIQEFIDGPALGQTIANQAGPPVSVGQAIGLGLDIARALTYAHSQGLLHGDLTPQNIYLAGKNGEGVQIKVNNFGLGLLEEGHKLIDDPLKIGSAPYLAPEQILGQPLDVRTDLYALGAILYELVTGQPPFGGSDQEVMQAHLNTPPQPPREINPQVSRPLDYFILKLLAKAPAKRYGNTHQVQRVLNNLGDGPQPTTGPKTTTSHRQRHPLVGRASSMQELLTCWDEARAGHGQLVFIAGETGIGKTRLTEELASQAGGATLLVGHCHALEGSLAYQPFIEALKSHFSTVPPEMDDYELGWLLSNVARLVPEIHSILPDLPEASPLEPKQEQLRLMNSLAQFIERATQERPWLLILDDLHWADQSSLQLLHYLARHCASMALLIIGTYQDTDLESDHLLLQTLHGLQRLPGYRTIKPARLDQREVGQMLANIWDHTIPDLLIDTIYRRTEGNPFYVEEVAKGLEDEGQVTRLDGGWSFATLDDIRLPQSVRDAVLRRIAQLSRDTQGLLRQAAILGRTFHFDDLRQMTDLSEWAMLEQLDEALERQLIQEAPGETRLRFSHAEIQQVLYEDQSALRRRLLHRQAGEALELRYLTAPRHMAEELAYHFDRAGELEKTLIYSIQAARHADEAYASQTALMWYNRATEVLDQLDLAESTLQQRFELLLARERLYSRQGLRDKQAADLTEAQTVAETLADASKRSQVHNQQAYYYRLINQYAEAANHARLGLKAARQAKNAVLEGTSLSNLAYIEQDRGQYQTAREHLEAAQAILEQTDDRRFEAIALTGLGRLHNHLHDDDRARAYFERALANEPVY